MTKMTEQQLGELDNIIQNDPIIVAMQYVQECTGVSVQEAKKYVLGLLGLDIDIDIDILDPSAEIKYLRWFVSNCDFGPAHSDVVEIMEQEYTEKTGEDVPHGWSISDE